MFHYVESSAIDRCRQDHADQTGGRMFVNTMPRYEILSRGRRRRRSTAAGGGSSPRSASSSCSPRPSSSSRRPACRPRATNVCLDPDFVLEQVAKAPREFDVAGAQPGAQRAHRRRQHGVLGRCTGRRSCARATCAATRRWTTSAASRSSSQSFPELDSAGGTICEPNDTPLDSRHLDMVLALQTLSDKPYMGSVTSGPNAADTIAHERDPVRRRARRSSARRSSISLINVNSPLRFDDRMLAAMFEYDRANQPVIITPFLLMGAMSPVTHPGDARAADGRGAGRHRARAARAPRAAR